MKPFFALEKELIKEVEPKTPSPIENRFPTNFHLTSHATPQVEAKPSKDESSTIETKESRISDQIPVSTRKNRIREQRSEPVLAELRHPQEVLVVEEEKNEEDEETESEYESDQQFAQYKPNKQIKFYRFVINQNTILHVIILL
jgi:hypothetical protein